MKIYLILLLIINMLFGKELFEDYYKEAEKILANMTIYEKIGQMFIGRYSIDTADEHIKNYHIGGFVLFANNIQGHTEEQLIKELEERQNNSKILLSYSVDEEGGTVCRVSLYFRDERFPSPRQSYEKGGIDEILLIEKEKIDLLRKLNFTVNFAPVADISTNESDYIHARTLGENATLTSEYINEVVDEYCNEEFTCCLKHFPGYGNNRNTHDDVAHDYRELDYLKKNDLVPFVNAIIHKVPMIMVSHNIVHKIDDEYPSSISKKVHDLLRDYGYTGLILTDSLSMGAIQKYAVNVSEGALAVLAGNDIIVTSTFEKHIEQVIKAYESNEIDPQIIEKAARRVIAWKLKYLYKIDINSTDPTDSTEPIDSTDSPGPTDSTKPTDTTNSTDDSKAFNDESNQTLYIILGIIIGIIAIVIIILVYLYYTKRKQKKDNNDILDEEENDLNDDKLIRDSNPN